MKRHFCGRCKKTNPRRLYLNVFCLFYRPYKMSFRCVFFARIDIFHMITRNFCLNFFDILKCVQNLLCTTGSSTPVSQNIMSHKNFYLKWYLKFPPVNMKKSSMSIHQIFIHRFNCENSRRS